MTGATAAPAPRFVTPPPQSRLATGVGCYRDAATDIMPTPLPPT